VAIPGWDLGAWDQPVLFGLGVVHGIGGELERLGRHRPIVLCSWRRERSEEFRHLAAGLGVTPRVFAGVQPHVPRQVVEAAWDSVRRAEADAVISFGGGSTIDLGKAVAYLASHGAQAFEDGRVAPLLPDPPVLHVALPTTYSGAESTHRLRVAEGQEVRQLVGPGIRPSLVVADPTLAVSLGPRHSVATAFTALGNCLEGSYARSRPPWTQAVAERATREVWRTIPMVERWGDDLEARGGLQAASYAAGVVLDQTGGALLHGLCQALGARTGVAYGVAMTILLPPVIRFNLERGSAGLDPFAAALGAADPEEAAGALESLARELRVPRALREAGVFREDIDPAARWAVERSAEVRRNPRPVSMASAVAVLEAAW
jgi:maleylacetate reductase